MANSIKELLLTLQKQAISWTLLGFTVVISYPIVIFNWNTLEQLNLLLPFGMIGIMGTMIWWFWTMHIIFQLLKLRKNESKTFDEILKELKSIRNDLQKDLDKNKTQ